MFEKIMALSGDFHENECLSNPLDLMSCLDNFEYLMVAIFFMVVPSLLDLVLSVHALHRHFGFKLAAYYSATAIIYMWYFCRVLSQHKSQHRWSLDSQRHERHTLQESISN